MKSLPEGAACHVQDDLATVDFASLRFLEQNLARYQVERLSLHLGSKPASIRQAAICYSLYVRQLDAVQEQKQGLRGQCAYHCPRPPVGCCNGEHHVILSFSDIMFAGACQDALHLVHVLSGLQVREHNHAMQQGRTSRAGYCSRLTTTGCSLRMFKSPRCIHYLCPEMSQRITGQYGQSALSFLDEMQKMSNRVMVSVSDFTSPRVMRAAESLFGTTL